MPRKLIDPATQQEIEVPDENELAALSAKAKDAEVSAQKLKEQEDLLKDPEFGNFKAMRDKVKAAEKRAEDAAKHAVEEFKRSMSNIDKPTEQPAAPAPSGSVDTNQIRAVLAEERITQRLGRYTDEKQREAVKHYFERLCSADERLDESKVEKRIAEAERLAIPQGRPTSARSAASGGSMYSQPPAIPAEGSSEEQVERGKELAAQMGYRFKSEKLKK